MTEIKLAKDTAIQLPFAISRFWDILFAPIWVMILILLFTNKRIREDAGLVFSLVFGLAAGLVFGLVFSLIFSLAVGLGVGLAVGLGVGLKFLFSKKTWIKAITWISGK